jgi:uncharacterized protein
MEQGSTILITGGTGLIGTALTKALIGNGYKVIILTRDPTSKKNQSQKSVTYAGWDIEKQTLDLKALQQADYIVHLAGAGIADKRWTEKRKQEIVDSRVKSGELLVKTLKENQHKVKAFISASAIGWYGNDQKTPHPHPFIETDNAADDFLGNTCRQWEASVQPVTALDIRLVKIRTGIVLSSQGGALKEFQKPIRFGIAAILGGGKQIISWIHIEDLVRIYMYALQNENLQGAYNAVAPHPVSNKELTIQLAKQMKGSFFVPVHVPVFVLKWMLGEMRNEVLKSVTVSSKKIKSQDFTFQFPALAAALKNV